jgi:hypothetical protein
MKPLARRSGFTTGKAGIDMEQVLLFIFYTLFFIVSSVVLLVVGLYSVWIHLDVKDEVEPEDRIFR